MVIVVTVATLAEGIHRAFLAGVRLVVGVLFVLLLSAGGHSAVRC
jgi:hypothetical protein